MLGGCWDRHSGCSGNRGAAGFNFRESSRARGEKAYLVVLPPYGQVCYTLINRSHSVPVIKLCICLFNISVLTLLSWHLSRVLSMTLGRPPMVTWPTTVSIPEPVDDEFLSQEPGSSAQPLRSQKISTTALFAQTLKLTEILMSVLR